MKTIEQVKEKFPYVDFNEKYQKIFDMIKSDKCYLNIIGSAGCGKAQPLNIIIPTPNGNKRFGDLKVGNFVFDRNGNPTKIIGVYPRGKLDLYKVVLSDGRETYCNDDHLWSYYTSKGNLKTLSLREIMDKGIISYSKSKTDDRIRNNCKFKIPTHKSVEFDIGAKLPIDPYVIGVFLGNGCNLQKQLSLSSTDEFIVKECAKLLNFDYDKHSEKNYTWTFMYKEKIGKKIRPQTLDIFSEFKDELCVKSNFKRIPYVYKFSSKEERLSLIQGLFDTDGSITQNEGRMNLTYSSTSIGLINDIKEVLLSLGYVSTIYLDERDNKNKSYNLIVNINDDEKLKLFRLPRKLNKINCRNKRRNYNKVGIKEIIPMNKKVDMMCIKVDNDEGLYLTSDYIVTHNTTCIKLLSYALEDENLVICATTGVASALLNDSGVKCTTLHSTFNLSVQDVFGEVILKKPSEKAIDLIDNIDYLIIDEMSMLSCDTFDYLIQLIHNCRWDNSIPKIILFSDVCQLPPVIKSDDSIKEYYEKRYDGKHYFFNSKFFNKLEFQTILFDKVYRQDKDVQFKEMLNRIRVGKQTDEDLKLLNTRVIDECEWEADHEDSVRICCTNKEVEKFNNIYLDVLDTPIVTVKAKISGDFRNSQEFKSGLYPEYINLKVGATVMITRNDVNEPRMFVNGDVGILKEINLYDDKPYAIVTLKDDNGSSYDIYVKESTTNLYDYDITKEGDKIKVEANIKGSYTNIPLKIAFASTVHKNQGKTLKCGIFDKGWWIANNGVYVALSRFRTLDSLCLTKPLTHKDIKVEKEALEFLNNL